MLELPGFRIGKAGIEKVYDLPLRGSGGRSQVEVNAVGRVIRELERKEGEPGADVTLTIDLELQRFAYERFGDESGLGDRDRRANRRGRSRWCPIPATTPTPLPAA